MTPSPLRRRLAGVLCLPALVALAAVAGCGDGTNRISGKVTFQGKPVPAGKVYLTPDASKGNNGATGYADIKDGSYDTSAAGGRGVGNGPVAVAIEGLDPSAPPKGGKQDVEVTVTTLFAKYETTMEVNGTTVKDFDVPAEAAKGPKQPANQGGVIP